MKKAILLSAIYFLLVTPVFAQPSQQPTPSPTQYQLLEPIPQLTKADNKTTDAATYIPGFFKLIIGIAMVLAIVRLIYAGIIKMTSDSWSNRNEANGIIWNAFMGLILTFGAWMIVYTILPNEDGKLTFDLKIPTIEIKPSATTSGGGGRPMTTEELLADSQVRGRLTRAGITAAGPCTQGQGYGCTNLNGLPDAAIEGLINLKSDCRCTIRVSGGTEPGPHQTHGVGEPIVDLSDNSSLTNWLRTKGVILRGPVNLSRGRKANFVYERAGQGNSTGNHWHVVF